MNEALLEAVHVSRVLLCCEACEAFLEEVDLKRVVAGHKDVDPQIVLQAIYQMGIRNVLRDEVAALLGYLVVGTEDRDTLAAGGSVRFHDEERVLLVSFSIEGKFLVVVWQEVGLRTDVEVLGERFFHSVDALPHQVLPAEMEALGEVVDSLMLSHVFEDFGLCHTCPQNVPLGVRRAHNAEARRLEGVDYRVVDVSSLRHLEA